MGNNQRRISCKIRSPAGEDQTIRRAARCSHPHARKRRRFNVSTRTCPVLAAHSHPFVACRRDLHAIRIRYVVRGIRCNRIRICHLDESDCLVWCKFPTHMFGLSDRPYCCPATSAAGTLQKSKCYSRRSRSCVRHIAYLLTLLQLPLIEVGNAVRADCYSIASYP